MSRCDQITRLDAENGEVLDFHDGTRHNVQEAKTRLSQALAQAEAGEEVIIARGGKPSCGSSR